MNIDEAKKILFFYRPGTADDKDPAFRDALQLARTHRDLAAWFEVHCESYRAMREKFQSVPIPAGLKEQILAERKIIRTPFRTYLRPILALAAVIALLAIVGLVKYRANEQFATYRKQMTEIAIRNYDMQLESTNAEAIAKHLQEHNAPSEYTLPAGFKSAQIVGCAVWTWEGKSISMLCFKSGRQLPKESKSDMWVFVADRKDIPAAPTPGNPVFGHIDNATNAAWSDDKKVYLLATIGDDAFIGKFLH